jgi:GTP-binding protein
MSKIPLITIVGVPNTGKSTLFNKLIGKRKALVHHDAGMTRDIYKKPFEIDGRKFNLQDSGGFFDDSDIITKEINKRVFREAEKSDLIIFLFDGKRELLGYEKDLFLDIVKLNSNIIPVINKVDNPEKYLASTDFYSLKQDFLFISAEHNNGIDELLERIVEKLPGTGSGEGREEDQPTRISIIGKPNVGKSSIINRILNDEYVIVSPLPGTTRDSVDLEIKRNNKTFILVDNAGIRKLQKVKEDTESAAVIRAEKDIRNADIIIFVIDVSKKIDRNDLFIAQKILKSAKPIVVACNKWDLVVDQQKADSFVRKLKARLNFFYFSPFILTSASSGKNIFQVIDKAEEINQRLTTKIKATNLNEVIAHILSEKKILTEGNKKFASKYVSIESYRPFFLNFFAKSTERIKTSDETWLKKRIQQEMGLEGIPIFIKISATKRKDSY